jgi:DnaJ-class molecular chaperone
MRGSVRPSSIDGSRPGGLIRQGLSLLTGGIKKVGKAILGKILGVPVHHGAGLPHNGSGAKAADVTYELVISARESLTGAVVEVELPHLENGRRVSVRIPPGVQTGTRLRLRDMGFPLPGGRSHRGDLYIQVRVH